MNKKETNSVEYADALHQQPTIPAKLLSEMIAEDNRRLSVLLDRYDPLTGKKAP